MTTINLLELLENSFCIGLTSEYPSPVQSGRSTPIPKTRQIALVGLFGALSIILTLISNYVLILAFVPPVNYLLFDLGEIPVMICFMTLGPRAGVSTAVIEWVALNLLPTSSAVIGPLFKFLSVASTLLGLWCGWKILQRWPSLKLKFSGSAALAALFRASLMTIPNALLLILSFHLSLSMSIFWDFLYLTAIFNVLQIPFDLIPTFIFVRLPQVKQMFRTVGVIWFESKGARSTSSPHS